MRPFPDGSNANSSESEAETIEPPKRNKRKNFKPRCSTTVSVSENNNVRRRKTLATRKLVINNDPCFSPIDLSAAGRAPSSDSASSDDEDDEPDAAKIPSSFSITNLSRPHVPETSGGTSHVSADMREYAVNTMRELLGIYGLTSEVAESITKQLPIAAFSTGEYFFT